MLEDPGVRLLVPGSRPVKATMLILRVAIEGRVHHVDQLCHAITFQAHQIWVTLRANLID